jgi:hypothetical protein
VSSYTESRAKRQAHLKRLDRAEAKVKKAAKKAARRAEAVKT